MKYIAGTDRNQLVLFPDSLEDFIGEENPVRVLDAFVEQLDMQIFGFDRAVPKDTGRPGYDPADMLRLYIYGYFHGIRSSRKLEKETHRNTEVMWLLRQLKPDFKTISDFRKDNTQAIKKACRGFTLLCREMGLIAGKVLAVDGSKFKALNSPTKAINQSRLERLGKDTDKLINEYLEAIERHDREEVVTPSQSKSMKKKLWQLRNSKVRINEILKKAGWVDAEPAEASGGKPSEEAKPTEVSDAQPPRADQDEESAEAACEVSEGEKAKAAVAELEGIKVMLGEVKEQMDEKGVNQLLATDPEARLQKTRKGTMPGYNVQSVVDGANNLIVDVKVTTKVNDRGLLAPMAKAAKDLLGIEEAEILADRGYYSFDDIVACQREGIMPLVPPQETSNNRGKGLFCKSDFIYNVESDSYQCPAGEILERVVSGKESKGYGSFETEACLQSCSLTEYCTKSPRGRRIKRLDEEDWVDKAKSALKERSDAMAIRKGMVEHPFGYLKQVMRFDQFLVAGEEKVQAEMSLATCAFNLKRAIKVMGVKELVKRIKEVGGSLAEKLASLLGALLLGNQGDSRRSEPRIQKWRTFAYSLWNTCGVRKNETWVYLLG